MPTPPPSDHAPAAAVTWVLDLTLHGTATLPDGTLLDRDALIEWLWGRWGDAGLAGIAEGTIDTVEAAARGLVDSALVLDAAAAPADRDWVRDAGQGTISCWFADEAAARAMAAGLAEVHGCTVAGVRGEAAGSGDDWRAGFTAIDVPGFGSVRPAWEAGVAGTAAGGTTIFIEPGAGFGTGLHETTQACLAAVAARAAGGSPGRVLDFGSGSGILAIAAAVRGAAHVDAVEVDLLVHEAIRSNAARNGVADRIAVSADVPTAESGYDMVIANIVAAVLLEHAELLCNALKRNAAGDPAGAVVLSGLLAADVPAVAAAYRARLGCGPAISRHGDWHCLRFEPQAADGEEDACR